MANCAFCNCKPLTFTDFELYQNQLPMGATQMQVKEVSPYYIVPDCGYITLSGKNKETGCVGDYAPEFLVIDNVVHNPLGFATIDFHRVSGLNCDETNLGGTQYEHFYNEVISINDNHTDYGKHPMYDCDICKCFDELSGSRIEVKSVCEKCFQIDPSGTPTATSDLSYNVFVLNDNFAAPPPSIDAPAGKKWIAQVQFYCAVFSSLYSGADFDVPVRVYFAFKQNDGFLGCNGLGGDTEVCMEYGPGAHADADLNASGFYDNNGLGYSTTTPLTGTMKMVYEIKQGGALKHKLDYCYGANVMYIMVDN